eukprot:tig00020801_g13936.t1
MLDFEDVYGEWEYGAGFEKIRVSLKHMQAGLEKYVDTIKRTRIMEAPPPVNDTDKTAAAGASPEAVSEDSRSKVASPSSDSSVDAEPAAFETPEVDDAALLTDLPGPAPEDLGGDSVDDEPAGIANVPMHVEGASARSDAMEGENDIANLNHGQDVDAAGASLQEAPPAVPPTLASSPAAEALSDGETSASTPRSPESSDESSDSDDEGSGPEDPPSGPQQPASSAGTSSGGADGDDHGRVDAYGGPSAGGPPAPSRPGGGPSARSAGAGIQGAPPASSVRPGAGLVPAATPAAAMDEAMDALLPPPAPSSAGAPAEGSADSNAHGLATNTRPLVDAGAGPDEAPEPEDPKRPLVGESLGAAHGGAALGDINFDWPPIYTPTPSEIARDLASEGQPQDRNELMIFLDELIATPPPDADPAPARAEPPKPKAASMPAPMPASMAAPATFESSEGSGDRLQQPASSDNGVDGREPGVLEAMDIQVCPPNAFDSKIAPDTGSIPARQNDVANVEQSAVEASLQEAPPTSPPAAAGAAGGDHGRVDGGPIASADGPPAPSRPGGGPPARSAGAGTQGPPPASSVRPGAGLVPAATPAAAAPMPAAATTPDPVPAAAPAGESTAGTPAEAGEVEYRNIVRWAQLSYDQRQEAFVKMAMQRAKNDRGSLRFYARSADRDAHVQQAIQREIEKMHREALQALRRAQHRDLAMYNREAVQRLRRVVDLLERDEGEVKQLKKAELPSYAKAALDMVMRLLEQGSLPGPGTSASASAVPRSAAAVQRAQPRVPTGATYQQAPGAQLQPARGGAAPSPATGSAAPDPGGARSRGGNEGPAQEASYPFEDEVLKFIESDVWMTLKRWRSLETHEDRLEGFRENARKTLGANPSEEALIKLANEEYAEIGQLLDRAVQLGLCSPNHDGGATPPSQLEGPRRHWNLKPVYNEYQRHYRHAVATFTVYQQLQALALRGVPAGAAPGGSAPSPAGSVFDSQAPLPSQPNDALPEQQPPPAWEAPPSTLLPNTESLAGTINIPSAAFTEIQVRGDGICLFRAIAEGLITQVYPTPVEPEIPAPLAVSVERTIPRATFDTLFTVRRVIGDGRCLFRSITQGLLTNLGETGDASDADVEDVRESIIRTIISRADELKASPFYPSLFPGNVTVEQHIQNLVADPAYWGGEPELFIAADLFRVPIFVYTEDPERLVYRRLPGYGEHYMRTDGPMAIHLRYNGSHYELLVPRQPISTTPVEAPGADSLSASLDAPVAPDGNAGAPPAQPSEVTMGQRPSAEVRGGGGPADRDTEMTDLGNDDAEPSGPFSSEAAHVAGARHGDAQNSELENIEDYDDDGEPLPPPAAEPSARPSSRVHGGGGPADRDTEMPDAESPSPPSSPRPPSPPPPPLSAKKARTSGAAGTSSAAPPVQPSDSVVVAERHFPRFGLLTVTQKDIDVLLDEEGKLNDAVIDYYVALLESGQPGPDTAASSTAPLQPKRLIFGSQFYTKLTKKLDDKRSWSDDYGFNKVKNWRWVKSLDPLDYDELIFLINHYNAHWTTANICPRARRFEHYDGTSSDFHPYVLRDLRRFMRDQCKARGLQDPDVGKWAVCQNPRPIPHQDDEWNCGVILCAILERILLGEKILDHPTHPFTATQEECLWLRRRIAAAILSNQPPSWPPADAPTGALMPAEPAPATPPSHPSESCEAGEEEEEDDDDDGVPDEGARGRGASGSAAAGTHGDGVPAGSVEIGPGPALPAETHARASPSGPPSSEAAPVVGAGKRPEPVYEGVRIGSQISELLSIEDCNDDGEPLPASAVTASAPATPPCHPYKSGEASHGKGGAAPAQPDAAPAVPYASPSRSVPTAAAAVADATPADEGGDERPSSNRPRTRLVPPTQSRDADAEQLPASEADQAPALASADTPAPTGGTSAPASDRDASRGDADGCGNHAGTSSADAAGVVQGRTAGGTPGCVQLRFRLRLRLLCAHRLHLPLSHCRSSTTYRRW